MTKHWVDIRNSDVILIKGSKAAENQTISFKYKGADEGRAEASLIAKYGWEQLNAQAA